jgi:hypothetical protein
MRLSSSKGSLARRLRKWRRSVDTSLRLNDLIDLGDMVDALCRWGASLPWSVELPARPKGPERRFAIDCRPLSCSASWFAVRYDGVELEDGPEILVVLPNHLAHRGVALGWAAATHDLDGGRTIATVAMPTTASELHALEQLLMVGYSTTFAGTPDGDEPYG